MSVVSLEILSAMDWLALGIFLVSYLGYPRFYDYYAARSGSVIRKDLYEDLITEACESSLSEQGRLLLAVEFRTQARSMIFLGTVSFLTLSGALSLFISSSRIHELLSFSLFERVSTQAGVRLRILMVMMVSGYALLQIIWGLKALYSVSLAIHTGETQTVEKYLTHLNIDFLRSIRSFYYLAVLVLWLFGAEFLIVGSVLLTGVLYRYDFLVTRN